jgi:hypothetical protein
MEDVVLYKYRLLLGKGHECPHSQRLNKSVFSRSGERVNVDLVYTYPTMALSVGNGRGGRREPKVWRI